MKDVKVKFSRRDFLRLMKNTLMSLIALGSGSFAYMFLVEPEWLDVENIDIPVTGLPNSFSGFRLVQISDIHIGGWMNRERLYEVIQVIRQQQADLVVVTGDFVFGHFWTKNLDVAAEDFISELVPLTDETLTLGVMGNHDHWTDVEKVRTMLSRSGIAELNNDLYEIKKGNDTLYIGGVDDIWEKKARLDQVIAKLPDGEKAILLAHEPDFADESAATGRFWLQLSGHSHGGQVVLPIVGPPILPIYGSKYYSGLYKVREMWQYTNRGVGMIRPPIRFNCRPEVTVITLIPA